jgi:acetyltransferase-like isoleucine patch superfamily enzyme
MREEDRMWPLKKITTSRPNYLKSIVLTVHLHARGWSRGISSVEGKYPLIVKGGTVAIGEHLAIRGTQCRVEIGSVPGGTLTLGERVFINWGSTVVAHLQIDIGDDCKIGELSAIFDTDHHEVEPGTDVMKSKVRIGNNVWIGRNSVVLPGVTIGDNAVIAAGSLVNADVKSNTLVGGTPARFIRELNSEQGWRRS